MGMTYYNQVSPKKSKAVLRRAVARRIRLPKQTGMSKRSFSELEDAVRQAGGQPLMYVTVRGRRVRRRVSRSAMQHLLDGIDG